MTYWHMQLHPDNKSWNREKEVLTETGLIGCWGKQGKSDYKQFQYDMKMGDIVLIRIGKRPIALVEVEKKLFSPKCSRFI